MRYTAFIVTIYIFFFLIVRSVVAVGEDFDRPLIDPGPAGGKSFVRILIETFLRGKGVKVTMPTGTPDPNITTTPETPIPFPTGNVTIPPGLGLNPSYNYPPDYVSAANTCLQNRGVYYQVQSMTGVPWQIMGGIHSKEGGCNPTHSCVSGRIIGQNEPDVHGNCSWADAGLGKPDPLPGGGCGFTNLLDSCLYGANHLKGKISAVPHNIQELAKALGRYNGTGNANCGKTPFRGCPPLYEGYDHVYPFNKFDEIHNIMYLVYCADYTPCNPPRVYTGIGVLTIASILARY